jgi:hypothetical protein
MVSSVREKIWQVEKEKKRQRRLIKEGVLDAVEERQEPKNDQPKYKEVEVREVPTEASDSNSVVNGGEVKAKTSKPKKKAKKANKKT